MPRLESGGARRELEGVLKAAGLELNGSYPYDVAFSDWTRLSRAAAAFVAGQQPALNMNDPFPAALASAAARKAAA